MWRPHPRIRKATKWSSTALALILVAVWGVSEFRSFGLETRGWVVDLRLGGVTVINAHKGSSIGRPQPHWRWDRFNRTQMQRCWWIEWDGGHSWSPFRRIDFPLWMPLCILLPLSGTAWRFDILARRRDQSHLCTNCSYNLTGLRPGSNCPECNTPPPKNDDCQES